MNSRGAIAIVLVQVVNAFALSASAQDLLGMATAEAMGVFDEVCGSAVPDFSKAEVKASALGFAFNEEDPVKDLSIIVKRSAEGVPMCDVTFGTNEQIPEIIRQLQRGFDLGVGVDPEAYGKPLTMGRTPRFEDEGYRDTNHVAVLSIGRERKLGRHSVSLLLWGKK